jgi:hypothetical protein
MMWRRAIPAGDVMPRSCIAMTSWNSSPNSGALETAAQQWGLFPVDRHPRSCDISFVHFRIFFIKTPIRVGLKASETQRNSLSTLCVILEGFAHIFLQIDVFVWRIHACRVYDTVPSYLIPSKCSIWYSAILFDPQLSSSKCSIDVSHNTITALKLAMGSS